MFNFQSYTILINLQHSHCPSSDQSSNLISHTHSPPDSSCGLARFLHIGSYSLFCFQLRRSFYELVLWSFDTLSHAYFFYQIVKDYNCGNVRCCKGPGEYKRVFYGAILFFLTMGIILENK